jgi:hypothetical protein
VSSSLEQLLSQPGVAGRCGFAVPFCLESVGLCGVLQGSFPVGAGWTVPVSFSVGAGRTVPASSLVGTRGTVPASFLVRGALTVPASSSVGAGGTILASYSVAVLVTSSYPSSARFIKSPPMLLSSFFFSFPLVDAVRGGSIQL